MAGCGGGVGHNDGSVWNLGLVLNCGHPATLGFSCSRPAFDRLVKAKQVSAGPSLPSFHPGLGDVARCVRTPEKRPFLSCCSRPAEGACVCVCERAFLCLSYSDTVFFTHHNSF